MGFVFCFGFNLLLFFLFIDCRKVFFVFGIFCWFVVISKWLFWFSFCLFNFI